MSALLTALGLGFFIGAQHAFEPDHLAAVGTMLPDEPSTRRAAFRGGWWGLGHGLSIAAIGLPLIALGVQVPEHLEAVAEFVVAVMLVGLGVRAIHKASRVRGGLDASAPSAPRATLPVGLVHGLAGSGAAIVLATTQSPSQAMALVFLGVFVLGSTLSMAATTALLSMPMGRIVARPSGMLWLLVVSGLASVAVGVVWGGPHMARWLA